MARSKRIIDIQTRVLPNGGALAMTDMNFEAPDESAKTAVAKAMVALNVFCDRQKLGFFLVAHDAKTEKPLKVTFTE